MKARIFALMAVAAMAFAMLPAHADDPTDSRVEDVLSAANRIPPGAPGAKRHVTLLYGPFTVPPGHDRNLVTVDVPIQTGFYTSVFPNLIDVSTGKEPTEQEAHIHHAHWFRITQDDQYEQYRAVDGVDGLSWVFGTGEERTGGTLTDRESTAEGWKYGIFLDGATPQALIFMIHNKTPGALTAYITLDIDMIYGTADQIKDATGQDMHPLRGVLTGTTQDALSGTTIGARSKNGVLMQDYTAGFSGTLVASASHMHPGGKWVYVVNLGGNKVCEGTDPDADGIPGTTLFVSKKIDQVAASWPYSEDYQMGGTQGGFRANIHQGDVIRQYGVYDMQRAGAGGLPSGLFRSNPLNTGSSPEWGALDGNPHAWYEAMSYTGMYSDTANASFPLAGGVTSSSDCTLANFAPRIQDGVPDGPGNFQFTNNPRETFATHAWLHYDDVCGVYDPNRNGTWACDAPTPITYVDGMTVDTIHVANFAYLPGDLNVKNLDGNVSVPLVKKGTTLELINDDFAAGMRHTFTSCLSPCDGPYVANYPLPDGRFDSGKLGNLDPIDGGLFTGDDTLPNREIQIGDAFTAGSIYNYYCSIHPTMRGAFKVVA